MVRSVLTGEDQCDAGHELGVHRNTVELWRELVMTVRPRKCKLLLTTELNYLRMQ